MTRPKGSKNKTKDPVLLESVKNGPGDSLVPAQPDNVEEIKKWTPAPDMGDIKEPPKAALPCKNCSDVGDLHYGGHNNWCNKSGCNCQGFK